MSTQEATPSEGLTGFADGLAFVMVASYFGSGSVFIASQAGILHGYTLLRVVVGAALLGFVAQAMSARLGIHGTSLMSFAREKLGRPLATAIAVFLSVGCIAWTLGLVAAVGAGVSFLLDGAVGWRPIAVATTLLAVGVGLLEYDRVENIMIAMMLSLMVVYVLVALPSGADLGSVAVGVVPTGDTFGALAMAAGLLGTTAPWPNFFLESILVHQKGWTDESDIPDARKDLAVGGVTTIAILVAAAALLRPLGFTQLESFITPGEALVEVLGTWAMVLFVGGVVAAAFNSIIPIMWAPAYIIPEAAGYPVRKGDRLFSLPFAGLTGIGVFSPAVSELLDTVILFPMSNGIFSLPVAAVLLFWAVNDADTMGDHVNGPKMNAVNALLVLLAVAPAALSVEDFIDLITGGGF